jgi:transcriptional regulator GlxA family with amidase domain
MGTFTIAIPEGALSGSVSATLDILNVANRCAATLQRPPLTWRVIGVENCVSMSNGIRLETEPMANVHMSANDVLILPGLGLDHPELGSGGNEAIGERYNEYYVRQRLGMSDISHFKAFAMTHHSHGGRVAASCSGVLILAQAGLLNGHKATTHWCLENFIKKHYPSISASTQSMVVDDRGLITAGAAMAQLDLMLYLLRKEVGYDVANLTTKYLLIDDRATQARYQVWDYIQSGQDDLVQKFQSLIESSLPKIISVREAAKRLCMTEKTLSRRLFKASGNTPMMLIQRVRMKVAHRLLAMGDLPIDEVAHRVGYANSTSLRKLTIKMANLPPGMLKETINDHEEPIASPVALSAGNSLQAIDLWSYR